MTWDFYRRAGFVKQFKKLDPHTKKRINKALGELSDSENPSDVGVYKPGMRVFAYGVGKYRIIFGIRYSEKIIDLMRVCDHKSAYGKD